MFEALAAGAARPAPLLDALARAAGERRLLAWSAHPAEQALLAPTVLGGVLPENDAARPVLGVFLNDGTGAKLDYYLRGAVAVTPAGCRPDGRLALRAAG